MGTFERSWTLMKESFAVLRTNKDLAWFPVVSGLMMILLTAVLVVPGYFLIDKTTVNGATTYHMNSVIYFILFFIFYFIGSFIVIFFNTGLVYCSQIALRGGDPTFSDGIRAASQRLGKIAGWAAISATVGMLLRMLRERLGIFGAIAAGLLGLAWNLLTFFVIPVLVFENLGVIESIKRSGSIFRRTWGENVVARGGIALVFFLLALLGILPIVLVAMTKSGVLIALVSIIMLLYWTVLAILSSSLSGILSVALYDYSVTGQVPHAYSPQAISGMFQTKERRSFLGR